MRLQLSSRISARQLRLYSSLRIALPRQCPSTSYRGFRSSARQQAIQPFLLADIGEGIRECEIIQWFVSEEARVEEWDKLCEVQSDKASVEITSRFAGVIKKLHYEAGDMAKVGKPLVDIDIQGEIKDEDISALSDPGTGAESLVQANETPQPGPATELENPPEMKEPVQQTSPPKGKHASLATPAVRHLTKELDVKIEDVAGTGRDGRVLKEDVYQFAKARDSAPSTPSPKQPISPPTSNTGPQTEIITQLSNTQHQMFKTMTKSLTIPHFLYADEIDFTGIAELRTRLNKVLAKNPMNEVSKLSFLPFIIKAVSMGLDRYPILNAKVDIDAKSSKPVLVMRSQHNIGVAMDTPNGLIVPVIKNVSSLTILSTASELSRLQSLARSGKLTTQDLSGGTITVSNIGSIGGTYVSPVIVDKEVAILGIGKTRTIPAFDEEGKVVRKQVCCFSWSADHRVVDGATMARAAEVVRGFVEGPDGMVIHLR
ncbi:related to branched-chain alpha-keto acid dehydrogenase complex, E2 component precursor (lipoamide acyltransferase) [Rhynchosporium secalis]|uniref:Dihydrolipoamide acetyltransferase component of pyruvate dehydrogenase complex n=1 Tax=Rhynchosporium secalis TaxID=38038 RepID=A0A1E1MGX1_RHYSE|nr:related to branched-chain alpha-keto acid dehydrogenase complex, E2 component precursor (lipoamide acyltransferase) [Rhynchosporium secalis]